MEPLEPISQPTANPTRKLSAATIAAIVVSGSGLIVRNVWPEWYDPDVWNAFLPLVVFFAGYAIKDLPNV